MRTISTMDEGFDFKWKGVHVLLMNINKFANLVSIYKMFCQYTLNSRKAPLRFLPKLTILLLFCHFGVLII